MEILNNFWSMLTTENMFIVNVIASFFAPVETYISLRVFTQLMKIDYNAKQLQKYVIVFSIVLIVTLWIVPSPYNVIINYLFLFVLIKYLFKLNILKTVFAVILPLLIFGLVNSLIMNPFLKLLSITLETAASVPLYKFIYLCLTYFITFTFLLLLKHINFKLHLNLDLSKKVQKSVFINLLLGILTLLMQAIINFYYINTVPIIFTLFNFGLIFAYFFFSFYSLVKATKLDVATMELENAESYNNSLTVLYDNVRSFKHDFDNMLNAIGGYVKSEDINGLKEYYSSLKNDNDRIRNVQILNPNVINNPAIYNLLIAKYKKATDEKIKINFEFFFDFENLKMPIYEFSRILGILLDNSIEAAKECDEKYINIIFREARKQNVQIVIIENTYNNKDVDTKTIFEKGISGKENHSGIGLWEVNEIIHRNNNIVLKTSKDDKLFKQELQIYY